MKTPMLASLALLAPRAAPACSVCFGQSDSPMAQATNMGIFLMLGVVAVVLGSFATFFIYLYRRARLTTGEPIAGVRRASGPGMSEGAV